MPTTSEAAAVQAPRARIIEALVRMGRAVQKANIYPEGHPAVPGAVDLFLQALNQALEDKPVLSIGIASDRFLVDGEPIEEKHGVLPWLAQHMHERGLAAIELDRNVPESTVVRFVRWLAGPVGASNDEAASALDGIVLTKFDYTRARFAEDPAVATAADSDSIRAWQSMMGGMAVGFGLNTDGWDSDAPEALAQRISAAVGSNAGLDAASLASRVIAMGVSLHNLPEQVCASVKRRLGAFIGGLTPDLRSQLLRVDAKSSRQKLEFVAEMVDSLPKSTVMEILGSLDKRGAHVPHQFITLMNKLIGVSAQDSDMREQVGDKLETMGVPRSLMDSEPGKVREVLTEVMQSRIEVTWNPEQYQALLEELSTRRVQGAPGVKPDHYGDPCDSKSVGAHVSAIALRLLVARPQAPEASGFLRCLEEDAPRALDAGRFDQAHDAARSLQDLIKGHTDLTPEVRGQVEAYLANYSREERLEKILDAVEASPDAVPAPLTGLFKVAGADAAWAAFRRLAERNEGQGRERLTELLVQADHETLTAVVGRLRNEGWSALRPVFPVLHRVGAPIGVELALTFVGNQDPRVRVEALRLLLALDDREGQMARYLERALGDESARVVAFAINHARQRGGPDLIYLLGAFLRSDKKAAQDQDLRVQAISTLASFRAPQSRDILIGQLAARKVAFSVKEERVSTALEEALVAIGDEASLKAVRAWRHSLSRWLTVLLVRGKVKDQ